MPVRHERSAARSGIPSRSTRCSRDDPADRRGEGAWLETADGRAHPRRDLVLVGDHPRPSPSRASSPPSRTRRDRLDQVIFAGFTHEPAETLARGADRRSRPPGLDSRVLFRQRLDLRRSRAEDGARLLAQHRRAAPPHRRAGARLSRRHDRHDVGRRARRVQRRLRAAAVRRRRAFPSPPPGASRRRSTPSKPPAPPSASPR